MQPDEAWSDYTAYRRAIINRDGVCFMHTVDPQHHVCKDQWGELHSPYDKNKLTVDHFHLHAGGTRGKRAPHTLRTGVAMCAWQNVPSGGNTGVPRWVRDKEREYSRSLYGDDCNTA